MKSIYSFGIFLALGFSASAQTAFWTEDFGIGCNQGQFAAAYSGTNGSWTVLDLTAGNNASNKFYISGTEAFTGLGTCGQGCIDNASLTNQTLHVGAVYVEFQGFPIVDADLGASYNVGGIGSFGFQSATDIRAESPAIDCSGFENILLEFDYLEGGEGSIDNALVQYFDGSAWALLNDPAKTALGCPTGQGTWTHYSYTLPAGVNNLANLKIAFKWVSADDGTGSDPSFAVDNITLSEVIPTSVQEHSESGLTIRQFDRAIEIAFTDVDEEIMVVKVYDILGQEVAATTANGTNRIQIDIAGLSGMAIVQIKSNKGVTTRKIVLR